MMNDYENLQVQWPYQEEHHLLFYNNHICLLTTWIVKIAASNSVEMEQDQEALWMMKMFHLLV